MDTCGATASGAELTDLPPPTLLNRIEGEGTKAFAIWTNTTVELERDGPDVVEFNRQCARFFGQSPK
jgi:hypothetical protein